MKHLTRIVIVPLALVAVALGSQSAPDQNTRCNPQVIQPSSGSPPLRGNPSASFKGYKHPPIIAFDIDESGTIRNARIKRSSGSGAADRLVLDEVRQWKYKPLTGCGLLKQEATVTIDFSAE